MIPNHRNLFAFWLFIAIAVWLFPASGEAYLDPGTGGLIYQIGLALISFVGAAFFVPARYFKNALLKIKSLFSKEQRL